MSKIHQFLQRWSRRKISLHADCTTVVPEAGECAKSVSTPMPLRDGARRVPPRMLFTAEHHNTMDMLDVYVGDYSDIECLPEALLDSLEHARELIARPDEAAAGAHTAETETA